MHNTKNTGYLFLLILITLFFCVGASQQKQPPTQVTDKVIVYYFHGNYRCPSCMTIERYTRESVEATFAKELKSGQIEFKSINVDLPANNHYVNDYKLYTKSVIVSDTVQGKEQRWKNLQKVWELLRSEKEFKAYVKSETAAYLQGKRS
jgi:thiol-disulfide isomerase/thioredoxin